MVIREEALNKENEINQEDVNECKKIIRRLGMSDSRILDK
jgi:hypothetical protein